MNNISAAVQARLWMSSEPLGKEWYGAEIPELLEPSVEHEIDDHRTRLSAYGHTIFAAQPLTITVSSVAVESFQSYIGQYRNQNCADATVYFGVAGRGPSGAVGAVGRRVDHSSTFRTLRDKWAEESQFLSSTTEIIMCESYQRIIGMGPAALPFIFEELKQEEDQPDQWFWALAAITRVNPVPRSLWRDRKETARRWLAWAKHYGYAT